jgi:hypothetical protein
VSLVNEIPAGSSTPSTKIIRKYQHERGQQFTKDFVSFGREDRKKGDSDNRAHNYTG